MTSDEILDMPAGREMDALVAENVMQWKTGTWGVSAGFWVDANGAEVIFKDKWIPSTDIAAAWEVVKYFENRTLSKAITLTSHLSKPHYYLCQFGMSERAKAETAPLSICRAALLAIMLTVPNEPEVT